ncbi:hypothetical protein [Bradyrhizobium sp. 27S5]|uniref:hypothetical protein n=1 Tax=Bradyrhizobium sp. 27S5 TaxID=3139728 RepID=UPI0030CB0413
MSRAETADDYCGFVVRLNADWRIVECRDRIQWILQRRGSPKKSRRNDWRGRSYCRTSEALIRCTREYAGAIDPTAAVILAALPARIELVSPATRENPRDDAFAKAGDHH